MNPPVMHLFTPGFPGFEHIAGTEPDRCVECALSVQNVEQLAQAIDDVDGLGGGYYDATTLAVAIARRYADLEGGADVQCRKPAHANDMNHYAQRPTAAEANGNSNWLGALVLHAEAVHGCEHTDQAREDAGLPSRVVRG